MGEKITKIVLTAEQKNFLDAVASKKLLCKRFYFTCGTPLSAFYFEAANTPPLAAGIQRQETNSPRKGGYLAACREEVHLFHRLSEDIDLFSEEEIHLPSIKSFIKEIQIKLKIKDADYTNFLGLHSFQLYFSKTNILKVDFNYYPFPRIEKGIVYDNLEVDSILDIAVNKVHTIVMKPRARDFIDVYFIIREKRYDFRDLLMKAKIKFDWHIDHIQLGSRLFLAKDQKDFPRMLKKIDHREWQNFFIEEARKLKKDIFE